MPLVQKAKPGPHLLTRINPFLPYETDLHVQSLPPHHELLLNKFYVVDHHLLVRHPPHQPSCSTHSSRCWIFLESRELRLSTSDKARTILNITAARRSSVF
jgi:hypothetical protein